MSPTKRTVSLAIRGRNMLGLTWSIGGAGFTIMPVSAATNTWAPAASAADLSIPVMRACAM